MIFNKDDTVITETGEVGTVARNFNGKTDTVVVDKISNKRANTQDYSGP